MTAKPRFPELILPEGERLVWQGRPDAVSLALRMFHMRAVAIYFVMLFAVWTAVGVTEGRSFASAAAGASALVVPAAITLTLLGFLGWLYSRTTRYTLTSRRAILQFGIALPVSLNVPYAQVASADVRTYRDGTGDIPLAVAGAEPLPFLLLWPYARPWRINAAVPMLRGVPDARAVAELLGENLRTVAGSSTAPAVRRAAAMPAAIATAA